MKRYSIFHPLFMSFFSKSLYQDVGRNWKGLCFNYLLLVLTLSLIPEMIKIHASVSDFLTSESPKFISQVPTITVSRGNVSINKPVPYLISNPEKSVPIAVIDTSGKFTSLSNTEASVLLTKTKLIVRSDSAETRVFDLSRIDSFVVDQKRIYSWVETFKKGFIFVLYPFVVLFSFLYYVIQVSICTAIGTFFTKRFKTDLGIHAIVRLSVMSFTPPIILQTVHSALNIEFPYSGTISFLIAVGYLYFAVESNSEESL